MPDTAPLSPVKAFFAENFLKKIMKTSRAANPSTEDWLRGFSGWPHPESAGSVFSHVLFPFEGMLNVLKLVAYITPALIAMRLMDDTLMPLYEDALDAISDQEASMRERGNGLLKLLTCAPLLLLMSTFTAIALTGGCLTATSDMIEKGHAFGMKLHPKAGTLFGGYVIFLSLILYISMGLEMPGMTFGIISLKLLSFCNQSMQTGSLKVRYAVSATDNSPASPPPAASIHRGSQHDPVTLPLFSRELQDVTSYGTISEPRPSPQVHP